jgi:hypothetical protein
MMSVGNWNKTSLQIASWRNVTSWREMLRAGASSQIASRRNVTSWRKLADRLLAK